MADTARILAIFLFAAKSSQGNIVSCDMGRFFLCSLRIRNAFFDSAAAEGDEKILGGLRRTNKSFCLFSRRKISV